MHRIDTDGHVGNLFDEGDPGVPRLPTQVDSEILNAFQEELANFITSQGIALVKNTNTQLTSAVSAVITALKAAANTWALLQTFSKGVLATQSTANGHAGEFTGNGAGFGVRATGGATDAAGVVGLGGGTNGPGVSGSGAGSGAGVVGSAFGSGYGGDFASVSGVGSRSTGGTNSNGGEGVGTGTGIGFQGTGGATGAGVKGIGGATSGEGVWGVAASGSTSSGVLGTAGSSTDSTAGVLGDGSAVDGYGVIAKGDTTTPARAAFRLVPQDSNPSNPQNGDIIYNGTANTFRGYAGGVWVDLH